MKQVARVISTYTADVSGVCSALYELGGMVVMHDPSGCNSTYNTHDEPRWYHMDSLIFISGLAEIDAIMGNDEKLIQDVTDAAKQLNPKFIALVRTPVPFMNGTDFDAIAAVITKRTGIPAFYFPTIGTHSYVSGVGMALEKIVDFYTSKDDTKEPKNPRGINLLGVTPLDFSINGTLDSIREFVKKEGFELICCAAMGCNLTDIARSRSACVNLVVSSAGLPAARLLERKYGIPYVVGCPIGPFADTLARDLREAAESGKSIFSCMKRPGRNQNFGSAEQQELAAAANPFEKKEQAAERRQIAVVGEAVVSGSLAAAIARVSKKTVQVICPLEADPELFVAGDSQVSSEEELEALFTQVTDLIADPMYRPICPQNVSFYELPHEAFSGRIYRKRIPNLVSLLKESII